jgi:hypothetical protein
LGGGEVEDGGGGGEPAGGVGEVGDGWGVDLAVVAEGVVGGVDAEEFTDGVVEVFAEFEFFEGRRT